MQMRILNKQGRCRITKYSQPDCPETKNVTHKWEVGVSGPPKLSHSKEDQPCFSTQENSVMFIHSYFTFFNK